MRERLHTRAQLLSVSVTLSVSLTFLPSSSHLKLLLSRTHGEDTKLQNKVCGGEGAASETQLKKLKPKLINVESIMEAASHSATLSKQWTRVKKMLNSLNLLKTCLGHNCGTQT